MPASPPPARIPLLDLGAQHRGLRAALDAAYARVMEGNSFILGPELARFEAEFAAFCTVRHAIGVGNGLDALTLALRALDIGPGHEVIVPAHTFAATWLAVLAVGATPVPCEPAPDSYIITAAMVQPLISARSRAVIAVHLYGQPADPVGLEGLCRAAGLALIEDAAQAHGATSQGRVCGSFGDAGCFSFYPTKNLGALGDGGAVVTSDDALAARVGLLRNYGAAEKYRFTVAGTNSRLDELQAAFLRVKLAALDAATRQRQAAARAYAAGLAGIAGLALPATPATDSPVWHLYVVRSAQRDALAAHLAGLGIDTGLHYPVPVYRNPAFRAFGPDRETATDRLSREVLSLPFWPGMPEATIDRVCQAVRAFFATLR